MGIVAFPVMFYSALVEWAGAAGKRWPFHPLLRDFNTVGVALFGWQAGLLVARLHGNTADVPRTIEGILFATVFAATVGLAYRSLDRSRLELIEAGEHESRAS